MVAPTSPGAPCSDLALPSRLAVIAGLALRGHLRDPDLDAVVATVASALDVPMSVIGIVTPDLQTYPAEIGVGASSSTVPDALSFCAGVVATGLGMVVADARLHPVYAGNPRVRTGAVRAFAGEPLVYAGHVIGTLSAFDPRPRTFTAAQLAVLQAQARVASALVRLRAVSASQRPRAADSRAVLLGRAEGALAGAGAEDPAVGIIALDVVAMRDVNEAVTSAGGDRVLAVIAERLQDASLPGEAVGNVGGDEFAVVCDAVASEDHLQDRAAAFLSAATGPVVVGDAVASIELHVGVAASHDDSADGLLSAAERAAVAPRADGPAQPSQVVEHALQRDELRHAIGQGELVLHYQPVIDLQSERMSGVEALVRWQHPVRGLLPPLDFVPLAEESGLIVDLGDWVLRTAAEQAAAWVRDGQQWDVAVNLSPRQMSDPTFDAHVLSVLEEAGAPVDLLVLEVTESALLDHAGASAALGRLRRHGLRLALDDFGTGYASFSYLRRFPIDILKVDRAFVLGLGAHADDEAIVASVVGLAHNTGKTVIAEGVESPEQASLLRAMGVERAQGFLWSKALPAVQVVPWATARGPARRARTDAGEDRLPMAPLESAGAVIMGMHDAGASPHTIAAALNANGRRRDGGKRWHVRSVARVVASHGAGCAAR